MQKLVIVVLALIVLSSSLVKGEECFTVGSGKSVVRQIHGKPDRIIRGPMMGEERWRYKSSTIVMSIRGRVLEWDDLDGRLKKEWLPGADTTSSAAFFQGSTLDDVLRLQGTPDKIDRKPGYSGRTFYYDKSAVRIDVNDKVSSWNDESNCLKVGLSEQSPDQPE
jgi:hypothetical protein